MVTCQTAISAHKKIIFCRCIADVEGAIFGVGLNSAEILQINAQFLIFWHSEYTYLRISYDIYMGIT